MRVNITLPGLICLAHNKNEINRKRRRFYHAKNHNLAHISPEEGSAGYTSACAEGRAAMRDISAICKLLGAKLHWGWSGNIQYISHQGKNYYARNFKKMSDDYLAEAILLGFGR